MAQMHVLLARGNPARPETWVRRGYAVPRADGTLFVTAGNFTGYMTPAQFQAVFGDGNGAAYGNARCKRTREQMLALLPTTAREAKGLPKGPSRKQCPSCESQALATQKVTAEGWHDRNEQVYACGCLACEHRWHYMPEATGSAPWGRSW